MNLCISQTIINTRVLDVPYVLQTLNLISNGVLLSKLSGHAQASHLITDGTDSVADANEKMSRGNSLNYIWVAHMGQVGLLGLLTDVVFISKTNALTSEFLHFAGNMQELT